MLKHLLILTITITLCYGFGQFHMKKYTPPMDSSEEDTNTVLSKTKIVSTTRRLLLKKKSITGTYRRCLWEQSKSLPRRLVLLSLCQNLFCENNQVVSRSRSIFVVEKMSRPNEQLQFHQSYIMLHVACCMLLAHINKCSTSGEKKPKR